MPRIRREYALLLLAALIWGSGHTSGKIALADLSAVQVAFLRPLLGCAVLTLLAVATGRRQQFHRELRTAPRTLLALGLLGYAGAGGLTILGLQFLPAGITSLFANTSPLMLVLGGILFFHQPVRLPVLAGAALGFAGVAALSVGVGDVTGPTVDWWTTALGVALTLGSAACWAAYTGLARRLAGHDALVVTALSSGLGALVIALLALPTQDWSSLLRADRTALFAMLWLGIASTGFTYALWGIALQRLPASAVAPFAYLVPVSSLVLASVVLGEPLTWRVLLGAALVLSGVALSQRYAGSPKPPEGAVAAAKGARAGTPARDEAGTEMAVSCATTVSGPDAGQALSSVSR